MGEIGHRHHPSDVLVASPGPLISDLLGGSGRLSCACSLSHSSDSQSHLSGLVIGFILGYGVRAIISYRRRPDTQDGNRTFFETSFVERHVLRQLSGSEDIGSEIMFSVLAQQNWGRVSDPNSRFERPNS